MPTILKFLKLPQKATILKVKTIILSVKICSWGPWGRQIFVRVEVLILYLFTTVKDFGDFSCLYNSSTYQTLFMYCSYFAVAKNPRDYSSYAVHQLRYAGRCVQGAVHWLHGQSQSVRKCDGQRIQRTTATCIQILQASSCEFWQIR
jgi:hypothetical protein